MAVEKSDVIETSGLSLKYLQGKGVVISNCIILRERNRDKQPEVCRGNQHLCHLCKIALADHETFIGVMGGGKTTLNEHDLTIFSQKGDDILFHRGGKVGVVNRKCRSDIMRAEFDGWTPSEWVE